MQFLDIQEWGHNTRGNVETYRIRFAANGGTEISIRVSRNDLIRIQNEIAKAVREAIKR